MNGQSLLLQLLLLVLIVVPALDARSGITATPHGAICSLEEEKSTAAPEHEVEIQKNTTHFMNYRMLQDALYRIYAEVCWDRFVQQMANVSAMHWCEWSIISRPYTGLRYCLENRADELEYGFPNALAENYTVCSHRMYFLNCTLAHPLLLDPPENVLLTLIITPICLIPFLVTLVVLKSKDGEMQA
ncbi:receptor activity-modifying protein 2 [Eublepharis macularius]|uniref:Receptor activity-modifying protein 2 n=1 Tax=Eublepharis macularius TaxID=481883 RepID=A0AA97LBI4_EUBMA|nr:receptor activity-modifying protein 2 [Eublepharis macularius]XP_054848746.1 receptor activity-modifying protein 2 [Eublepharis macularius]